MTDIVRVESTDDGFNVIDGANEATAKDTTNYISVTSAAVTITDEQLIAGLNVIGVNFAGTVTIQLPAAIAPTKVLIVKDESANANNNNIIINRL